MEKFLYDYKKIKNFRKINSAPVDHLGAHILPNKNVDPKTYRYQVLISVLISSRTKDEKTAISIKKLQNHGLNVNNILKTSESDIKELIKEVGFMNTKAKYIKDITKEIHDKYNNDIPNNLEELLKFKGIGPKIGTLIMLIAWDKITGISVDSHIHRIANTLNWVNTKTPLKTKNELELIVPKKYWKEINRILVGYGQLAKTEVNIVKYIK